jgi:hypothetical protein
VAAALSAGIAATLGAHLPYKLGLIVAALTGIVVGLSFEAWATPPRGRR